MIAIEEFIERFGEDAVARGMGENFENGAVFGHWVYVRKCKRAKVMLDTPTGPQELYMPDKTKDTTTWCEVLAKGVRVGKKRHGWTKRLKKERNIPMHLIDALEIGDIVLAPNEHDWGIIRSPFYEHEYLIDEAVLICKYEPDG